MAGAIALSDCSTVELSVEGVELTVYRERFWMCLLFSVSVITNQMLWVPVRGIWTATVMSMAMFQCLSKPATSRLATCLTPLIVMTLGL